MMRGLLVPLVALLSLPGTVAWASCQVERETAGGPGLFVRHVGPDCSQP